MVSEATIYLQWSEGTTIALVLCALGAGWRSWLRLRGATVVFAEVVEIRDFYNSAKKGGWLHRARIAVPADSAVVTIEAWLEARVGDRVKVAYPPGQPEAARPLRHLLGPLLLLTGAAIVSALCTLMFLLAPF
jgi:hypothetical protein